MTRSRRATAAMVSVGLLLAVSAIGVHTAPTAEASDEIVTFEARGTGFGHGRGMSQLGAIGRALDGQGVDEILDAYYGGTVDGTRSDDALRVRILSADDRSEVGVVSSPGSARWAAAGGSPSRARWSSITAVEVAPNRFDVYASGSQMACFGSAEISVPSGPLGIGAAGAEVEDLQRVLNALGHDAGSVDGDFGPRTEAAVERFEAAAGLLVDGRWTSTERELAVEQLADIGAAAGWSRVASGVSGPISFTTDASSAPDEALGLCRGDGTVRHYSGAIEVLDTVAGNRVVNEVDVEEYLRGVVPMELWHGYGELGNGRGMHALRAQAVASRSYAMSQHRYGYADTCDTTRCQLYAGSANRSAPTSDASIVHRVTTDRAIADTRGRVRVWADTGELAATEFSASNGPRTAGGAFPPVDDPWDDNQYNPNHTWSRSIDAAELASVYELASVDGVATVVDDDSPYDGIWANEVRLADDRTVSAWSFRNRFDLPSPGFTLVALTADGSVVGRVGRGSVLRVPVTGRGGVPDVGVGWVSLNVTAVQASGRGWLRIWGCDGDEPESSLVNFVSDGAFPNAVVVPVGASGEVCVSVSRSTHVVVDVLGWSGAEMTAAEARLLDTRRR